MQRISDYSAAAAWLTLGVMGVVVLWSVARLFWLTLGGPELPETRSLPVPEIADIRRPASQASWALFGEDRRTSPLGIPVNVRQTPLALKLRGTVATGEEGGYAVIVDESGEEAVYRRGDVLPGGAEVVAVEARRVLLRREGETEALELPRESTAGGGTGRTARRDSRPTRSVSIPGIRGMSGDSSVTSVPALSDTLGIDTAALADSITVMPVRGGGFRVRPGRSAGMFRELGLQANDVVTAVNGRPLQSQADVQKIFDQVRSGGQISITVRRQGRERVLTPDLSALKVE